MAIDQSNLVPLRKPHCADALKAFLEMAERGELDAVAIVGCTKGGIHRQFALEKDESIKLLGGVHLLSSMLVEHFEEQYEPIKRAP